MADLTNNTNGTVLNGTGVPAAPGTPGGGPNPWKQGPYGSYQPAPYNWSAGPDAPGQPVYQTGYDPSTMGTANPLQTQLNGINLNTQGLDAFRQQALRTGPSQWAGLATQQQGLEEKNAREGAQRDAAGQTAQAQGQMAMRGGITSGSRERLATEGARNQLNMTQGIARQGSQNRLQIGVNDEQNRIEQLGMLPGMENTALQPGFQKAQMMQGANQFDVGQSTQEMGNKNAFNAGTYNSQMGGWAANKASGAIANSGK